jgi:hypothetical protein
MRLDAPKSVVLGEALELKPIAVGRDSIEQLELELQNGDAFPMYNSNWRNGAPVKCSATPNPSSWECSYPARPGTYPVTVTAKSWKHDSVSVAGKLVVRRPK